VKEWNLERDAHCVDESPMSGGLATFTAGADDPIPNFGHLDQVAFSRLAELAVGKRT